MSRILATTFALLVVACTGGDLDDYEVVSSSSMVLAEPDSVVPEGCRQVGVVFIPGREVSLSNRLSGAHLEVFFSALNAQAAKSDANYLLPTESPDSTTAAATGAEFHASLFQCPG